MRAIHSLPEPKEYGFRWRAFEKARKKLERVEDKRKELQRRAAELKARIESEEQEDVKRLAAMDDARERRERGHHPLLEAINRAHQAKAEADKQ